jgi:hypothetical protein
MIENNTLYLNGHLTEKYFIAQTLKNSYWLRDKITEIVGIKIWIYPILVFTNAFVPFTNPVKGIKVINQKYLLTTIKNINSQSLANNILWDKRDSIVSVLK